MKILIALLLMLSVPCIASECAPVNLINEPHSPFKQIPVYDQGEVGICYAYMASTLANYHLIKKGHPLSVNPIWVALAYAQSKKRSTIKGGLAVDSLEAIKKLGNCPNDESKNLIKTWAVKNKVSEEKILELIDLYASRATAGQDYQQKEKDFQQALKEEGFECADQSDWKSNFPELTSIGFLNSPQLISKLMFGDCEQKKSSINIPDPDFKTGLDDKGFRETLNKKIDNLKAPVGVTFCSQVLEESNYKGVSRQYLNGKYKHSLDKNCKDHEATIVGKKMVNGQCHFLLRNSYGSGYSSKTYPWKCFCKDKTTGKYIDDCTNKSKNASRYSFEGCWIPENSLIPNTYGLTSLGQ